MEIPELHERLAQQRQKMLMAVDHEMFFQKLLDELPHNVTSKITSYIVDEDYVHIEFTLHDFYTAELEVVPAFSTWHRNFSWSKDIRELLTEYAGHIDIDKKAGVLYIHWINVKDENVKGATEIIVKKFERILTQIFE